MRGLRSALLLCLLAGNLSPPNARARVRAQRLSSLARTCNAGARGSITLFKAAYEGEAETLQRLLDKDKYDVDFRSEYGQTPLYTATLNNHPECMRKLIRAGAKLNLVDDDGWTALMAAAAFGESKLIRILLEAGANPTRRATGGPHKGLNAKDLAKNLSGKPTMQKRCIELLEGATGCSMLASGKRDKIPAPPALCCVRRCRQKVVGEEGGEGRQTERKGRFTSSPRAAGSRGR